MASSAALRIGPSSCADESYAVRACESRVSLTRTGAHIWVSILNLLASCHRSTYERGISYCSQINASDRILFVVTLSGTWRADHGHELHGGCSPPRQALAQPFPPASARAETSYQRSSAAQSGELNSLHKVALREQVHKYDWHHRECGAGHNRAPLRCIGAAKRVERHVESQRVEFTCRNDQRPQKRRPPR